MADSEVMRVGKAEMIRVLHAEPSFGELFTAHLLTRNSRVEADLVDQLFNSSGAWRGLLMLAISARKARRSRYDQDQPGDAGRDHRHDAAPRQLLHEQVQEARFIEYNGTVKVHSSLLVSSCD